MNAESVWTATTKRSAQPPLDSDINTDVLIVGGGMCGILLAHRLKEIGVNCVVVEGKTVGSGITKNTTAKITAQHGLIYADLLEKFGIDKTRQYYHANIRAIHEYRALAEKYLCDFEEKTAYVYSTDDKQKLEREARAYNSIGIPVFKEENIPLPFETHGAIAMKEQAQFHPLKLLYALADEIQIYENTLVNKIDGQVAYTANGKVTAERVVLATHYPMVNVPGLYFLKLYQHRSYVVALKNIPLPSGMYIDEHKSGYSFRTYGDLLFVGGGSHRTGKKGGGYAEIREFIKSHYPDAVEKYHWATQDCMSLDKVPYIGRHRAGAENLYVANGFNKWGMSGSMVAAMTLTNMITSNDGEILKLFSPQRGMINGQLLSNIGAAAKGLMSIGGPRCAHMGCKLHRNVDESTWDCSCHGSRFDVDGYVIDNPAKKKLK